MTAGTLARKALAYEAGMWRSLYRWVLRRPARLEAGAQVFGYAAVVTPLLIVFIVVSAIEIPVVDLLLPWPVARIICWILGLYGLLWMIGLLAGMRVHPHVVAPSGLRIRSGPMLDLLVPWEFVAQVRTLRRSQEPGRSVRVEQTAAGAVLELGLAKQTSVEVVFDQPTSVELPSGLTEPLALLRFHADDPDALVAAARAHLTARSMAG